MANILLGFGPAMTYANVPTGFDRGAAKRAFIIFALAGLLLLAFTAGLSVLWAWENTPAATADAPTRTNSV